MKYQVIAMRELPGDMSNIILEPKKEKKYIAYQAGQYIQIQTAQDGLLSYSIANAPRDDHRIELLIRHSPKDAISQRLIQQLRDLKMLEVLGPFGDCIFQNKPNRPIILVAGGTGFAQIKALIEAAEKARDLRLLHLFWSIHSVDDCFRPELMLQWLAQLAHFKYNIIVSKKDKSLDQMILETYPDLLPFQMFISGPWPFVDAHVEKFLTAGLQRKYIYSDRFSF